MVTVPRKFKTTKELEKENGTSQVPTRKSTAEERSGSREEESRTPTET